jgi:hypothetical protein
VRRVWRAVGYASAVHLAVYRLRGVPDLSGGVSRHVMVPVTRWPTRGMTRAALMRPRPTTRLDTEYRSGGYGPQDQRQGS